LEKNSVTIAKRNDGKKIIVKISMIKKEIPKLLEQIQKELYKNAEKILKSSIEKTEDKKQLIKFIKEKKMVLVPMCSSEKCEDILKEETGGAKTLFIDPENTSIKNKRCIICNKPADYWVYVGKTY
jgi:prolyl-tRNA synthetase